MQMRVMKYGTTAPELAATANISAFNVANAVGGLIGGAAVDSSLGASAIPTAAAVVPLAPCSSSCHRSTEAAPVRRLPLAWLKIDKAVSG
jgi:predicted MFS family arabinose efflux permease